MITQPIRDDSNDHQATILLVDDDPGILETTADLLMLSGYTVLTATDGTEALPILDQYLPDVIVSDIMMPEMNGYELFEAVRSKPQWAAIPFIFLTARGQQKDVALGHRIGADAYLTKPFEPDDLMMMIENRVSRLRQIASLTEADYARLKQEILTVFSHELRTPLTYIVGYSTLLEEHRSLDADSIDDMLSGIQRGSERLVRLVEDLMLMVRIDGGVVGAEIMERRIPCQSSMLINEVVQPFRKLADERNVQITTKINNDVTFSCLPMYIEDAFRRLVDNALKFSKQEGGDVLIQVDKHGGAVMFTIQDDGIGIKPAQQKILFERFRQLDRDVMEQQGVGLGLTIARSLVRLHGGDIEMESVPGKGSIFRVRLPIDEREAIAFDSDAAVQVLPAPRS